MVGQKSRKGVTKYCFIFDSWCTSKNTEEIEMEVGAGLIGMVKTNTKGFCNNTIEKLTEDWSGCSYRVLRSKPMVPRERHGGTSEIGRSSMSYMEERPRNVL